jgi:hypothetical protein
LHTETDLVKGPDASFSLGPAKVAGILSDNALGRITDPRRRTYVMSRIAKDFNAIRLQIERIISLSGIRRSKGDLRREAMAREDLAAEEKIAAIHQRFGSLLADEDLVKIKSQEVHKYLADPTTPLRGRLMSKAAAIKANPEKYQLHRGGEYDGSDGVSRSVFGGQNMPDQAAQELFDHGLISEPTADAMWESLGNALGRLAPAMLVGRVSVLAMQWLQTGAASFKMPSTRPSSSGAWRKCRPP